MLSDEANENGEKTGTGLISKKTILNVQHTFLYISLPFSCTTTTWNFQKLPGYTFLRGKVVLVFVCSFFFTSLIAPWWTLAFLIFLPPLQNFMLFLQQKKSPLFFLSLQLFFSLSFAGLSPYFLFFSVFLFLYIPNFLGMTINLSLYFRQRGQIQ